MSNAPDDFAQFMRQREAAALDYVNGNPESLIRHTDRRSRHLFQPTGGRCPRSEDGS
ncbi:MAG: hypothetical protein ACLQUY_24830 [Ktedonobacterales bacterium]